MLEILVILAFVAVLMACVVLDISIVYALVVGYFIFFFYGVKREFGAKNTFMMSVAGVKTVKNLLITFLLIGVVTALWRAAGTIPVIICYASKLIHPSAFVVIAFLLNALISLLTGTAFGTAATMGVICTTIASTMQMNPVFVGGAVLSGVYFGDRCSPVSTSALQVSELSLFTWAARFFPVCSGETAVLRFQPVRCWSVSLRRQIFMRILSGWSRQESFRRS